MPLTIKFVCQNVNLIGDNDDLNKYGRIVGKDITLITVWNLGRLDQTFISNEGPSTGSMTISIRNSNGMNEFVPGHVYQIIVDDLTPEINPVGQINYPISTKGFVSLDATKRTGVSEKLVVETERGIAATDTSVVSTQKT